MKTVRTAETADIPLLKEIWLEGFGECDETTAALFFETAFLPENSILTEENGEIGTAAYYLDGQAGALPIALGYGVSTRKRSRKAGNLSLTTQRLLDLCKQRGKRAVLLVCKDSSKGVSEQFGFAEGLFVWKTLVQTKEADSQPFLPCSFECFLQHRKQAEQKSAAVSFDAAAVRFLYHAAMADGGVYVNENNSDYAVFCQSRQCVYETSFEGETLQSFLNFVGKGKEILLHTKEKPSIKAAIRSQKAPRAHLFCFDEQAKKFFSNENVFLGYAGE